MIAGTTEDDLMAALDWRDAAFEAGWRHDPGYAAMNQSFDYRIWHPDTSMLALCLVTLPDPKFARVGWRVSLHVWDREGVSVRVPMPFDFGRLKANLRHCEYCKAYNVDTVRVGMTNRGCLKCKPVQEALLPADYYR